MWKCGEGGVKGVCVGIVREVCAHVCRCGGGGVEECTCPRVQVCVGSHAR